MRIIVILILLVLILLCTVAVTAADIDISVDGDISNWAFTPGTTNIDSTNISLNVSSISSTWTVSVKDDMDFHKTPGTVGRMAESDAVGAYTGTKVLGTAMTIAGPTEPTKTIGSSVVLSGSNQVIESGLTPVTGLPLPLTISQPVTISDQVLGGGHRYQVIVTFIAFAEGGPEPVVSGIVPVEGITGTTVTVTDLSGSNFLPHSTAVLNRTGSPIINLTVTGVTTPNRMTGTLTIPANAMVGRWDVTVMNPDGRIGTKPQLFWIKYPAAPEIGAWTSSGTRGATNMYFWVSGTGFQNGVAVNLTYGSSVIQMTGLQVDPIFISGSITIPLNATADRWDLTVTNNDGQSQTRTRAFLVK